MIGSEYKLSNGGKIMLALVANRKKPQLYILEGGNSWRRVAVFDDAECLKLFLSNFNMVAPDWVGQTYQEALEQRFPFIRKDRNDDE